MGKLSTVANGYPASNTSSLHIPRRTAQDRALIHHSSRYSPTRPSQRLYTKHGIHRDQTSQFQRSYVFPPARFSFMSGNLLSRRAPTSLSILTVHAMESCQQRGRAWMGEVDAETVEAVCTETVQFGRLRRAAWSTETVQTGRQAVHTRV